jgi:hypothetical protein
MTRLNELHLLLSIHSYVAIRKRDGDRFLVDILIVSPIDDKKE